MMPDYPGIMLSFGRHVASGLIALVTVLLDHKLVATLKLWRIGAFPVVVSIFSN